MNQITIIGVLASVCTGGSLRPQLIKIYREKKTEGISVIMLIVLFTGCGLWVYYGFLRKDWIIIISNSISFMINIAIALFAMKYKNRNVEH